MKAFKSLAIGLLLALPATSANAIEFVVPIDCKLGTDCFIQNYVDADPSAEAKDYKCGYLTYPNSQETDFRLKDYSQMDTGVRVLAAAGGTVLGVRDDMDDISVREINPTKIKGKECGNAIVIDHGDGWKTQYCHIKKNTAYVNRGDKVEAGQQLGRVGLSGDTAFPHLSFIVRHEKDYYDPFNGAQIGAGCSTATPEKSLWKPEIAKSIQRLETALLGSGFADGEPNGEQARLGKYAQEVFPASTTMLVIWADVMGIQPNDILTLEISDPHGNRIIEHQKNFTEPKAQQFYFTGKRSMMDSGFEPGIYSGKISLLRSNNGKTQIVIRKTIEAYIR